MLKKNHLPIICLLAMALFLLSCGSSGKSTGTAGSAANAEAATEAVSLGANGYDSETAIRQDEDSSTEIVEADGQVSYIPNILTSELGLALSADGEDTAYDLIRNHMIYGVKGATYNEWLKGGEPSAYEKELTILGIHIGDDVSDVLALDQVQADYAIIDIEADGDGDGTAEMYEGVYADEEIDTNNLNAYDVMIGIAYYYQDGEWHQLNYAGDSLDNYEVKIEITFDIQGPYSEYGVEVNQVSGIYVCYR